MAGRENDVIGGVNTFLDEQKKLPDPAAIAFVRFDDQATERFRPMQALNECKPLTVDEYQPRGGTPLLDAVGRSIAAMDDDWKNEKAERAILVIVTDGQENASREYSKQKIKEMIKARQDSGKWAIIYLGANVDAFAEASSMGIQAANTAGYVNSAMGTKAMYAAASNSVGVMRSSGRMSADNLGGNIEEDGTVTKTETRAAAAPTSATWVPPISTPMQIWTPPA